MAGPVAAGAAILLLVLLPMTLCDVLWRNHSLPNDVRCIHLPVIGGVQHCAPGTTFKIGCNRCMCMEYGTMGYCFIKNCQAELQRGCSPGRMTMIDCNTCICSKDGRWGCTKKICANKVEYVNCDSPQPVGGYPGVLTRGAGSSSQESRIVGTGGLREWTTLSAAIVIFISDCTPKKNTYQDHCNVCHCLLDGTTIMCIAKKCANEPYGVYSMMEYLQKNDEQTLTPVMEVNGKCNPYDAVYQLPDKVCVCMGSGSQSACLSTPFSSHRTWPSSQRTGWTDKWMDVITAIVISTSKCNPKQKTYVDDCNVCHCLLDGTKIMCIGNECRYKPYGGYTMMKYLQQHDKHNLQKPTKENRRCNPVDAVFRSEHKVCVCMGSGEWAACIMDYSFAGQTRSSPQVDLRGAGSGSGGIRGRSNIVTAITILNSQCIQKKRTFDDECNVCHCLLNGNTIMCIGKECQFEPYGVYSMTKYLRQHQLHTRVPAVKRERWCNTFDAVYEWNDKVCICVGSWSACLSSLQRTDQTWPERTEKLRGWMDVITAIIIATSNCTPKQKTYEDDCNICHCLLDGMKIMCVGKECKYKPYGGYSMLEYWKQHDKHTIAPVIAKKEKCNPVDAVFQTGPYVCVCMARGSWAACVFDFSSIDRPDFSSIDQTNFSSIDRPDFSSTDRPDFSSIDQTGSSTELEAEPAGIWTTMSSTELEAEGAGNWTSLKRMGELKGTRAWPNVIPAIIIFSSQCTPKQKTFADECNFCHCLLDGKTIMCVGKKCQFAPYGVYSLVKYMQQYDNHTLTPVMKLDRECTRGVAVFQFQHKVCVCESFGSSLVCLSAPFRDDKRLSSKLVKGDGAPAIGFLNGWTSLTTAILIATSSCTPKQKTYEDDCNVCHCLLDGMKIVCLGKECKYAPYGGYSMIKYMQKYGNHTIAPVMKQNEKCSTVNAVFSLKHKVCVCMESGSSAACLLN